jgi:glycosyltransferase involved in cell wall biosynthesis
MRAKYGVSDNQLLLGTVGSYYLVKGQRFLIDAMKKVIAIYPMVKMVMAGQGPLAEDLRKQVNNNGLGANVQIVGYVEDTPGFLSALDIFVMPSLSEGQPLALLEAAANGRCIVATHVGGIPEIVANNKSAVLVPPGDVDSLADALVVLIAEPGFRVDLAANASMLVQKRWSIQRTADQYLALLLPGLSIHPIAV